MAKDASIVFTAKDNFSSSLSKIISVQKQTKQSTDSLQKSLDLFNKTKFTLKTDLAKARSELKEAQKNLDGTREAAERLDNARITYDNLQSQLKLVSKAANQAEKDLINMQTVASKSENHAGSGNVSGNGIISRLGASGAAGMVGNLATEIAGKYISSAFGSEASTMFSSILGSATQGAAIGTVISPGIGTAVGAIAGSLMGAVSGAAGIQESKDEAFKSVRDEIVSNALESNAAAVENGTAVASGRETTRIAFNQLLGEETAGRYLQSVLEMANKTPYQYEDLTAISRTLATYGYSPDEMLDKLGSIGDAGAALNLGTSDMNMVATALGRMSSTGKASLEYINMLQERGIDAIGILGNDYGLTNAEVYDAISKNLIDGAEAAETINKAMQSLYGGSMEKLSETYSGLLSTLEDSQNELDNAAGEGYLEERKKGLKEQIAWMQSSEMEEGYRLMGQYEAKLENDKEELLRKALDDVKNSEEYQKALAEGNGVEAGRLLAEAKSKAQMEYNSSQGVQDQVASEKKLIENVTEMLVQDETYYNAGYILGIERGKGIKAGELAYLRGDAAKISEGFFTDESEKFDFAAEQRAIAALENQYLTENNVTINVSGEGDADAVADRVSRKVLEAMATLQPR